VLSVNEGDQWPNRSLTATTSIPAPRSHEAQTMAQVVERDDRDLRFAREPLEGVRRDVWSPGLEPESRWPAEDELAYVGEGFGRLTIAHRIKSRDRGRIDFDRPHPLDPKTANHLPQCEFVTVTDPAVLRVLLKVTDKGDYAWVECGSCEAGWQVAFYAA
jgi:hypothetical protein